ncbi:MAG: B12-binding domain-containing radical SAM protein [Spirochaetes bacterium]|nr:B12-binding domain-containing radical SAM protein [Spirochaetota bacterium]
MKRMLFIEPKSPGYHIFSRFPLPRLGIFILATIMRRHGWDVEVVLEETRGISDGSLAAADLVCISTITPTAMNAYRIGDRARRMGKTVLLGGPHATFLAEEALGHADFVIRGEGEQSITAFADAWSGAGDFSAVRGLSYWKGEKIIHNPQGGHIQDLDSLPIIDYRLLRDVLTVVSGYRIIPVQTSRGCPFDCSFCSVTGMFGKKYRFRSHNHVMEELRRYSEPNDFVFFYDDNFTANRARAKELLRRMIGEGLTFPWSTQVRVDVARDEDLLRLMKRAGCHTLFIGFESVNPASLKEMKKGQTVEEITGAIGAIKRHGIHIHGMFVFGFDQDTPETVASTVAFARRMQLSSLQFLLLTPLPGSVLFRDLEAQGRITTRDWSQYDTHHVVFRPKGFTPYQLQMAQVEGHDSVYSLPQIARKLVRGNMIGTALGVYARNLNRSWRRLNADYLRQMKDSA